MMHQEIEKRIAYLKTETVEVGKMFLFRGYCCGTKAAPIKLDLEAQLQRETLALIGNDPSTQPQLIMLGSSNCWSVRQNNKVCARSRMEQPD